MRHHDVHPACNGSGYHDPGAFNELEGDLDVQGLLGLDYSVPPGYEQIRIRMHVKADCPDKDIDDLLGYITTDDPELSMRSCGLALGHRRWAAAPSRRADPREQNC